MFLLFNRYSHWRNIQKYIYRNPILLEIDAETNRVKVEFLLKPAAIKKLNQIIEKDIDNG